MDVSVRATYDLPLGGLMTEELALETRGLVRTFGGRRAVDDLALQVPRGEVFGFLGQNGAGKTTTMRMLLGLIRPTAGEVRLFGQRLEDDRLGLLARTGALVENPAFYPFLSGRKNLIYLAKGTGRAVTREQIDESLRAVDLHDRGDDLYKGYSRGMKQRLGIAWAIVGQPELVLLDEPLNGLDPPGVLLIRNLIRDLVAKHGVTVFLSSHLLHEVELSCDRVAIIDRGRLIAQGSVAQLLHPEREVLEVEVDDPERARDAARALPFVAEARIEPSARERRAGAPEAPVLVIELEHKKAQDLVRGLVQAGHVPATIVPRRRTLEELYHQRVAESRHVPVMKGGAS